MPAPWCAFVHLGVSSWATSPLATNNKQLATVKMGICRGENGVALGALWGRFFQPPKNHNLFPINHLRRFSLPPYPNKIFFVPSAHISVFGFLVSGFGFLTTSSFMCLPPPSCSSPQPTRLLDHPPTAASATDEPGKRGRCDTRQVRFCFASGRQADFHPMPRADPGKRSRAFGMRVDQTGKPAKGMIIAPDQLSGPNGIRWQPFSWVVGRSPTCASANRFHGLFRRRVRKRSTSLSPC